MWFQMESVFLWCHVFRTMRRLEKDVSGLFRCAPREAVSPGRDLSWPRSSRPMLSVFRSRRVGCSAALWCIRAPGSFGATSSELPCDGGPRDALPFAVSIGAGVPSRWRLSVTIWPSFACTRSIS